MRTRPQSARGLTLIEIMVALLIAALLFSAATMGVGALLGTKARQAASELAVSIRALDDHASLSGKTCRLVFALPHAKSEEPASYWAECAKGNVTTRRDREEELREAESRASSRERPELAEKALTSEELMAQEEERVDQRASFAEFRSQILAPRTLPSSVKLEVWTPNQREVITSGRAFLYFFPQGSTERALLKVRQGDNVWTIRVSPLTGKAEVVAEDLEVPRS